MKPSSYIKRGWCQGSAAVDKHGVRVQTHSKRAVKWCILGALAASNSLFRLRHILEKAIGGTHPPTDALSIFNDAKSTTQKDVITLLESIGE